MQAKTIVPWALAIFIVIAVIGATGVAAENQNSTQPGLSSDNSTGGMTGNGMDIAHTNNSTLQPQQNVTAPINDNFTAPVSNNGTVNVPAPINSTAGQLTMVLENHTYYPNDTVRIYVYNATAPLINITDPLGTIYNIYVSRINDSAYLGEYTLNKSIILANYTVMATDNVTRAIVNDSFEVTTRTVSVTPIPNVTVTPDGKANQTVITQPSQSLYLYLNLSKADYLPAEQAVITVKTNAGMPTVVVQDPANNTVRPALSKINDDTYTGNYSLEKAIILGNYTVLAYVNGQGTYNYTIAYFNVTIGKSADNGMHIQYAAYDPVQKAIVVRANISSATTDTVKAIKDSPAMKGMALKSVKTLLSTGNDNGSKSQTGQSIDKKVEVTIPIDDNNVDNVTKQYNLSKDITKATTSMWVNANGTDIHISLNDKVDGCWYRLSASIPAGYNVVKITRADGTEIKNDVQINRSTGQYDKNDVNWYIDNGTLYFYDDPINGYDITLLPPVANNSLAVNVIYGGQLSAIIYPFNQTDTNTIMAGNDHLGRTGDNGYANEIDADAGSKTAVRMNNVNNGNTMIFGNDGLWYHTYNNANYQYTDNGQPVIVGFNTVPDGSVESVIISNYVTPQVSGSPSYVNITHKTIIRNNNLWFATVYYINNSGGSDINGFRFYQGCDFNFNGQYSNDDDFYDPANDTVYGHYNNGNPNAIQTGGYRSTIWSSAHDVNQYGTIWNRIAADNLRNGTSTNGIDGGMALAWDNATLKKGQTWVIPIIWAVGQNTSIFSNTLNYATTHNVYDVGIKSIDTPTNGKSVDSLTTPVLTINATAMDLGVTDQSPAVFLTIKNSSGSIVYSTSTSVQLSVPYQETAPVSFNWNLAGVPAGMYNISVYTQLAGDQNSTNDQKNITVYVRDFSLYPDQWVHASPGDNVLFPLTLSNMGLQRTFELNLSQSTAGWASNLYYNNTSILMATDTTGDGKWDWVNASYNDTNGLPAITIPASANVPLLIQKLVPATADTGILDTETLYAYPSGQPLINSSAILHTDTPLAPMANKTFYLHNMYLNTTPESSATGTTAVTSIFAMWVQVPAFADNFMISSNVSVPIYYTTTSTMPITLTIFYTNGAGNSYMIGSNTSTIPASASQTTPSMFNFTINPTGGNVTVPRGSYLVVKIDNQQTTTFNVWYTNTYKSRVDVKTPTYVHVGAINTYNVTTPATSFNPGDTLYVTANVTDPIGAYDIPGATITLTAPNGTALVNNQSISLNLTDTTKPALWKLFNYTYKLDSSLPPGVYGINITGYESNGVVNRKNISITLMSGIPAVLIYPNNTKIAAPGTILSFKHSVTNLNAYKNDTAEITVSGPSGWAISLFKADGITPLVSTDGDGIPDTGNLLPSGSTDIVVQVTVPGYATLGSVNLINVTAISSQNVSVSSMVTDNVLVSTASVVKTLYLHDNGTQFMNTSMNNSANDHTDINSASGDTWNQSPAFARNFNILDDPMLTMYLTSANTNIKMNVSIISSNSTASTVLGSIIYQTTVVANTRTKLNFSVPLNTYNITIPRGNQLSLHIDNQNNNKLTISQSALYPSHIDMDTLSYINVQSISIYDSGGNTITGTTPPSTIKVVANVTDPFGSFDISDVNLTVLYPNNTVAIAPLNMNLSSTDSNALSLWKLFERNVSVNSSLDSGNYNIIVTANESNSVKSNMATSLLITYPIYVDVSKSLQSSGSNNFLVNITIINKDNHTVSGVHAYDFYANDFSVSGFSLVPTIVAVNNTILKGNVSVFGPITLSPNQSQSITYTAQGIGNYNLSNMTIVGVDPYV